MKKTSNILWGLVLVALGVIFALNALDIADFNIFFDGWWTLLIIVPAVIGLFTESEKTGNVICIIIGAMLFLWCRDILDFSTMWKLIIPAIIVVIGLKLIFRGIFGNKANEMMKKMKSEGKTPRSGFAAFSENKMNFDGEVFEGAELNAIFGGIECNLTNAVIEKDQAIQATAIFGGIDIFVPENVNVKVDSFNIFGGASNKSHSNPEAPTIHVNAICLFGGIDIKCRCNKK
jgi:predicted membrane protein